MTSRSATPTASFPSSLCSSTIGRLRHVTRHEAAQTDPIEEAENSKSSALLCVLGSPEEPVMENRWCTACAKPFQPRPQSPRQTYCTAAPCQLERRRLWQKAKRTSDPDYLENQLQAQRAWNSRNADYWRTYRSEHPAYVDANRLKQRQRNEARRDLRVAKMDASMVRNPPPNGMYTLTLIEPLGPAKMGVWIVYLTLVATPSSFS